MPPTIKQAQIVAQARIDFPINLGDCFAYALAKEYDCPVMSLDTDFKKTDVNLVYPD